MNSSRRGFLRFGLALGAAKALRISGLASEASGAPLFLDVPRSSSGIEWVHENAMSPSRYLPEAVGPGCAFLDYDNDGWMDIFLVNSGPSDFWKPSKPVRNALYRNNRDGTFTDVTEKAGVAGAYFGMGAAVGDYDNDGSPDIFVTAYGKCILYKNSICHTGKWRDQLDRGSQPGISFDPSVSKRAEIWKKSFVRSIVNEQKRFANIGFQSRIPRFELGDFHPSMQSFILQCKIGQPFS